MGRRGKMQRGDWCAWQTCGQPVGRAPVCRQGSEVWGTELDAHGEQVLGLGPGIKEYEIGPGVEKQS